MAKGIFLMGACVYIYRITMLSRSARVKFHNHDAQISAIIYLAALT